MEAEGMDLAVILWFRRNGFSSYTMDGKEQRSKKEENEEGEGIIKEIRLEDLRNWAERVIIWYNINRGYWMRMMNFRWNFQR